VLNVPKVRYENVQSTVRHCSISQTNGLTGYNRMQTTTRKKKRRRKKSVGGK
jgi:hypothetical protein